MNLAKQLHQWRGVNAKNGRGIISQAQAAKLIGVNLRTLQDWELGRAKPRGIGLRALLDILKTKPKPNT